MACMKCSPHASRAKYKGASTGPDSDGVSRIATNLLDVPAEIIYFLGVASEEKLLAHLTKLKRQVEASSKKRWATSSVALSTSDASRLTPRDCEFRVATPAFLTPGMSFWQTLPSHWTSRQLFHSTAAKVAPNSIAPSPFSARKNSRKRWTSPGTVIHCRPSD